MIKTFSFSNRKKSKHSYKVDNYSTINNYLAARRVLIFPTIMNHMRNSIYA